MPGTLVLGLQWGDEGKGKIVDILAESADCVARYNGGDNAGHTVVRAGKVLKLHLIPSGVLHPKTKLVLGNGMVINPVSLIEEIDSLSFARGMDLSPDRLKISGSAHLVFPYHRSMDMAMERVRGGGAIGTTARGIGPCYADKSYREGFRFFDLQKEDFLESLASRLERVNLVLARVYNADPLEVSEVLDSAREVSLRLKDYCSDTTRLLWKAYERGETIVYEGAHGALLDIDHGTYPYVTSSSTTVGGVFTGLGISPKMVNKVIGVAKAYQTRVGAGPFPTEIKGDLADLLVEKGAEFGTTTGRKRRVGWLDFVSLAYAVKINGVDEIALTKLDVLSGLEEIQVCVGYDITGDCFPRDVDQLSISRPCYKTLQGWDKDLSDLVRYVNLPVEARRFVEFVEDYLGVPVGYISVGPDRTQTIFP